MRAGASRSSLRLWRRRCRSRLGLWLGRSRPGALRAATDIDHGAVTTLNFRIHPAQDQYAAVEGDHFPILGTARLAVGRPDEGLAAGAASQAQLRGCRLIGKMHHDAASGTKCDHVRLLALPGGRCLRPWAILVLVIGGETPATNDILWRESRRQRRSAGRRGR